MALATDTQRIAMMRKRHTWEKQSDGTEACPACKLRRIGRGRTGGANFRAPNGVYLVVRRAPDCGPAEIAELSK